MTGAEFKRIRKSLEMERGEFALLIGYRGSDRNNETKIKRLEDGEQVPLYIARFVWLIQLYFHTHNGNLPSWPNHLRFEGSKQPWM